MTSQHHFLKVLEEIEQVVKDIKSIKIQGATNIAKEAFKILKKAISEITPENHDEFEDFLRTGVKMLEDARPTEPMLFNGMKYVLYQFGLNKDLNLVDLKIKSLESLDYVLALVSEGDDMRSKNGADLIKDGYKILTHCHSGSVVKVLREAWRQGKKFEVYNTETRPLYQGRLTSQDLIDSGIPTTMIVDDMAPFFVDNSIESSVPIDIVILGCDAIKTNGNVVNKVGSFGIGLSARHSKIPVYIVGSLTKVDCDDVAHIETRSGDEIWPDHPKELKLINYAFDMVPAEFITGIITRDEVIKPEDIFDVVKSKYPWMLGKY